MTTDRLKKATLSIVVAAFATPSLGGSLLYAPVNPTFGGHPLNGGRLLSEAQAQNQYNPKAQSQNPLANLAGARPQSVSPSQQFANQLTSQLYASLANKITQAMFGPNAQTSGTYTFQGTTISFNRVGNNIEITIYDGQTTTTLTVPAT